MNDVAKEATPRRRPGRPRLTEPSPEYRARLDEIVAAAAKVFRERGYAASTLDDVAEALDLRRASLYYYVRSKSQLLSLVSERALAVAIESIDEFQRIEDPAERLAALVRMHATLIAGEPALAKVFLDERASLAPADQAQVREVHRRYFATFAAAVEASIDAGVLPRSDPRLSAFAVIGMVTWVYKWFRPGRDDPGAYADMCVALLLEPRPGVPTVKRRRTSRAAEDRSAPPR